MSTRSNLEWKMLEQKKTYINELERQKESLIEEEDQNE